MSGIVLMSSVEALAGSQQVICRSARNSVVLASGNYSNYAVKSTRDSLVVGEIFEPLELRTLNQQTNITVPGNPNQVMGSVVVTAFGPMTVVSTAGGEACRDGQGGMTASGPGSETVRFTTTVRLTLQGASELVHLTCRETSVWSGRCLIE
jgi:hypothetical protein